VRGYFVFVRVWAGERDLVTILVSTISYLMYISVVMDCVTVRVLNLSSILSSNGCNFLRDFDLLSFFWFIRCVGMGGLCGVLRLQVLHAVFRSGNELIFTHTLVRLLVVLSRSGVVWCSFFFPLSLQSVGIVVV
jgi:hypothetical protein